MTWPYIVELVRDLSGFAWRETENRMLMQNREKEKRRAEDWEVECPLGKEVQKMNSEGIEKEKEWV